MRSFTARPARCSAPSCGRSIVLQALGLRIPCRLRFRALSQRLVPLLSCSRVWGVRSHERAVTREKRRRIYESFLSPEKSVTRRRATSSTDNPKRPDWMEPKKDSPGPFRAHTLREREWLEQLMEILSQGRVAWGTPSTNAGRGCFWFIPVDAAYGCVRHPDQPASNLVVAGWCPSGVELSFLECGD